MMINEVLMIGTDESPLQLNQILIQNVLNSFYYIEIDLVTKTPGIFVHTHRIVLLFCPNKLSG